MRIHSAVSKSAADGPGERYCLWVQGCSRRCPGCFNPETWERGGGKEISVETLLSDILATKDIEGITLLGGEPFEQAQELAILCRAVREHGLSVVAFTGFTYEALLMSGDESVENLLQEVDLLIDGPFLLNELDFSRPWTGSSNQRYLFLTNRYSQEDIRTVPRRMELRFDSAGNIILNGMPDANMFAWLNSLGGGQS